MRAVHVGMLLLVLVVGASSTIAGVVVADDFEASSLGSIIGQSPIIGDPWYDIGSLTGGENVVNTVAIGTQSLEIYRNYGGGIYPATRTRAELGVAVLSGSQVTFEIDRQPGQGVGGGDIVFSVSDMTLPVSNYSWVAGVPYYHLDQNGNYNNSGVNMTIGDWDHIAVEVDFTDSILGAGFMDATYEILVNGNSLFGQMSWIGITVNPADNYWDMRPMVTFYGVQDGDSFFADNLSITHVPEPATVMLLGLGVLGLIKRKKS